MVGVMESSRTSEAVRMAAMMLARVIMIIVIETHHQEVSGTHMKQGIEAVSWRC